jgi:hypothetical protein
VRVTIREPYPLWVTEMINSRALRVFVLLTTTGVVSVCMGEGVSWFEFCPSIIRLSGRLVLEQRFGPPNYGENPDTDAKLMVPYLKLKQPVNVKGDPTSEVNRDSVLGVTEVRLYFPIEHRHEDDVGREVIIQGCLSRGLSAHDYGRVVMDVKAVTRVEDSK